MSCYEAAALPVVETLPFRIILQQLSRAGIHQPCVSPSLASPIADEDLSDVRRCLNGDGNAFRYIVERHQARISAMMWKFARDRDVTEDLVQDVFVEACANLTKYRMEAPFEHWLAGIATRVGYRYWRKQKRERAVRIVPIEDWDALPDEPADETDPAAAAAVLYRLLEQLPPRDRLVLTLRYVENHSVERTAELTGWSVVMVKVQALRARKKLKRLFDQAVEETDR